MKLIQSCQKVTAIISVH